MLSSFWNRVRNTFFEEGLLFIDFFFSASVCRLSLRNISLSSRRSIPLPTKFLLLLFSRRRRRSQGPFSLPFSLLFQPCKKMSGLSLPGKEWRRGGEGRHLEKEAFFQEGNSYSSIGRCYFPPFPFSWEKRCKRMKYLPPFLNARTRAFLLFARILLQAYSLSPSPTQGDFYNPIFLPSYNPARPYEMGV